MRFINGTTLDRAAAGLSLERRLELVKTVAEAVHAAHQVGLIHRHLKPAKILLEDTAEGSSSPGWWTSGWRGRKRSPPPR